MITWVNFFRKLTFDPVRTKESGSKMSFRTIHGHVIDKLFENSLVKLSHVINLSEEKFGWIKSESACICSTWLTSFTYFTGSKFGPPRIRYSWTNFDHQHPLSFKISVGHQHSKGVDPFETKLEAHWHQNIDRSSYIDALVISWNASKRNISWVYL